LPISFQFIGHRHTKIATQEPVASFQQNLGVDLNQRPFLSILEPSPPPGDTATELSAYDCRPTFISHIHLTSFQWR